MLYDPKWEKTVKSDPFTIEALIGWLERQPAEDKYNYNDCRGGCLFGLYMTTLGISWKEAGASCVVYDNPDIYHDFRQLVYQAVATCPPWTFGAALDRARAISSPDGTNT